jgi:hypothetical protein
MITTNVVTEPVHIGWIDKDGDENPFPRVFDSFTDALGQVVMLNKLEREYADQRAGHTAGGDCWFVLVGELSCERQFVEGVPDAHHWIPDTSDKFGAEDWMLCKYCPAKRTRTKIDPKEGKTE